MAVGPTGLENFGRRARVVTTVLLAMVVFALVAGCGRSAQPQTWARSITSLNATGVANSGTEMPTTTTATSSTVAGANPTTSPTPGSVGPSVSGSGEVTTARAATTTVAAATVSSLVLADAGSGPCGSLGRLETGITDVATATGDLDRDGRLDAVVTYRGRDGVVRLRAIFGAGGGFESPQPGVAAGWKVLGLANLSGPTTQGGDVVFVALAGQDAVQRVGLARLDGCSLVPITTDAGVPVELRRGGQTSGVEGFRCETRPDAVLDQYHGTSGPGGAWSLAATAYTLVGNRLVQGATAHLQMTAPQFAAYLSAACGSVS